MEDFKRMIKEMDKKEFLKDLVCFGIFTIGMMIALPYIIIFLG